MTATALKVNGYLLMPEIAAPSTPASNTVAEYPKSDGHLYQKDDAGTETDLAGGSSGVAPYVVTIGNGSATSFTITHNLGTKDVIPRAYSLTSPYAELDARWEHTTTNTLTLYITPAPATNDVRVIVSTVGLGVQGAQGAQGDTGPPGPAQGLVPFVVDNGGTAITTGVKNAWVTVPYDCTITAWRLLADQSGSIVIDVLKDTYANFPPTNADTIAASAKPTITTAQKAESSTLTGWTTALTAGEIIGIEVESVTSITKVRLELTVVPT